MEAVDYFPNREVVPTELVLTVFVRSFVPLVDSVVGVIVGLARRVVVGPLEEFLVEVDLVYL